MHSIMDLQMSPSVRPQPEQEKEQLWLISSPFGVPSAAALATPIGHLCPDLWPHGIGLPGLELWAWLLCPVCLWVTALWYLCGVSRPSLCGCTRGIHPKAHGLWAVIHNAAINSLTNQAATDLLVFDDHLCVRHWSVVPEGLAGSHNMCTHSLSRLCQFYKVVTVIIFSYPTL